MLFLFLVGSGTFKVTILERYTLPALGVSIVSLFLDGRGVADGKPIVLSVQGKITGKYSTTENYTLKVMFAKNPDTNSPCDAFLQPPLKTSKEFSGRGQLCSFFTLCL